MGKTTQGNDVRPITLLIGAALLLAQGLTANAAGANTERFVVTYVHSENQAEPSLFAAITVVNYYYRHGHSHHH